jgi:UDP:flavonoid glycosyltransferase YjiC (YdhE family)
MSSPAPRLLFVPVSGQFGVGEYARSLAIARALSRRWPDAVVHFVLSQAAPYAADAPYPTTLLPSSPTFHSAAVAELIAQFRPTVVLFDNAGRTAQLRAARLSGARVIFISARRRQRRKAFRWRWMRLLDEHWIAYPAFIAGSLGILEKLKLQLLGRPTLRFLDVILPPADPALRTTLLARCGVKAGSYVLVVPGGGTGHPGAADAVARFHAAAAAVAATGVATLFVGPAVAQPVGSLRSLGSLPQAELVELMRGAQLIIANGGSTLLQAIACGTASVAVPIADDQGERIRRCVAAGVCVTTTLDAAAIAATAGALLADESARAALAARAAGLELTDGITLAVTAIAALLALPRGTARA